METNLLQSFFSGNLKPPEEEVGQTKTLKALIEEDIGLKADEIKRLVQDRKR